MLQVCMMSKLKKKKKDIGSLKKSYRRTPNVIDGLKKVTFKRKLKDLYLFGLSKNMKDNF